MQPKESTPESNINPVEQPIPPEVAHPQASQPIYPTPGTQATPSPLPEVPKKKFNSLKTLIIALFILFLGVGAYAYYQQKSNKNTELGGSASLNGSTATSSTCIPVISTNMTQTAAVDEFKKFADAVKTNNQSCADGLSSDYFIANSKDTFGEPSGKWIAFKNPFNGQSMQNYFKQLPASLTDSAFKQVDYTRPTVVGKNYASATGLKLSYPLDLTKVGGDSKNQVSISFVLDKNQIRVDDLVIEPLKP